MEDYQVVIGTGSAVKWFQPPDLSEEGMDVFGSLFTNPDFGTVLADDFLCTESGPIRDMDRA